MTTTTEPPKDLRHALHHSEAFQHQKRLIEDHGKKCESHRQIRDGSAASLKELEAKYAKLLQIYEDLGARVTGAKETLKNAQERNAAEREKFLQYVGDPQTSFIQHLQIAKEIVAETGAVELIRLGLKRAETELAAQAKEMLEFFKGYSVDSEIAKQISQKIESVE